MGERSKTKTNRLAKFVFKFKSCVSTEYIEFENGVVQFCFNILSKGTNNVLDIILLGHCLLKLTRCRLSLSAVPLSSINLVLSLSKIFQRHKNEVLFVNGEFLKSKSWLFLRIYEITSFLNIQTLSAIQQQ